jgi:hypothetical protein
MKNWILAVAMSVLLAACASRVESGPASPGLSVTGTVILAPFANATDDDHAGRAFTGLFAAELARVGLSVVELPPKPATELGEVPVYERSELAQAARRHGASAILAGTAVEFRYKTDLDGDPAAGVVVEVMGPDAGAVLWRASGSNTGIGFTSLTAVAQRVTQDVTARMPR